MVPSADRLAGELSDGGTFEINRYRTMGGMVTMQLATEFSSSFLENGGAEREMSGDVYLYTGTGGDLGLLWFSGRDAVTCRLGGAEGAEAEALAERFREAVN